MTEHHTERETVEETKERLQKIESMIRGQRVGEIHDREDNIVEQQSGDIDSLLQERGSRYGKFSDHAYVTQALKQTIYGCMDSRSEGIFNSSQKESLDMIAHKIGRIVCGDPNYIDSWDDIAGYAKLVADQLRNIDR